MPPDFRRLSRGQSVRAIVIASNLATVTQKNSAAYVCDGIDDDVEFQAALDALPSTGGKIILTDGAFALSATVTSTKPDVVIEGAGPSTFIGYNGVDLIIEAGAGGWSIRDLSTDGGSTYPAPVSVSDPPAATVYLDLGTPQGGVVQTGGIMHVIGTNMTLLPPIVLEGTSTDTGDYDATTFVDSALSIVLNAYADMIVGVTSSTDGVAYGEIASNTTDGTFVIAGWIDPNGDACAVPDGGLYSIWDISVDLNTLSGGSGNQLLFLSVGSPVPFNSSVAIQHNADNIWVSTRNDISLGAEGGDTVMLVRQPSESGVRWIVPMQGALT